jgi:hypothetical protein
MPGLILAQAGTRIPAGEVQVDPGSMRLVRLPTGEGFLSSIAGQGGADSGGVPAHGPSHHAGGPDELALVDLAGDLTAARVSDFAAAADARVAVHAAATDPHPQYLTAAEGAAAYDAVGAATAAVAAHAAATDPHPQYLTPAEGSAAYDALGAATAEVAAHASAADPHPVYTTAAEVAALLPGYAARSTLVLTTSSLAPGATDATLTITVAAGIRIIDVTTDRASRTRIYASAAQQTADASRAAGTLPTGDPGLCYELVTTATVLSHTETVAMHSKSGAAVLYVSIANNDAITHTVQVTITYQRIE